MSNPKIIIDKFGHNAAGMSKFGKGFSDKASIEKSVSRGDSFNAELSRRPERRDDYRSDQARLLETSVAATGQIDHGDEDNDGFFHQVGHFSFSFSFFYKREAYLKATDRPAKAMSARATSSIHPCVFNAPFDGTPIRRSSHQ